MIEYTEFPEFLQDEPATEVGFEPEPVDEAAATAAVLAALSIGESRRPILVVAGHFGTRASVAALRLLGAAARAEAVDLGALIVGCQPGLDTRGPLVRGVLADLGLAAVPVFAGSYGCRSHPDLPFTGRVGKAVELEQVEGRQLTPWGREVRLVGLPGGVSDAVHLSREVTHQQLVLCAPPTTPRVAGMCTDGWEPLGWDQRGRAGSRAHEVSEQTPCSRALAPDELVRGYGAGSRFLTGWTADLPVDEDAFFDEVSPLGVARQVGRPPEPTGDREAGAVLTAIRPEVMLDPGAARALGLALLAHLS